MKILRVNNLLNIVLGIAGIFAFIIISLYPQFKFLWREAVAVFIAFPLFIFFAVFCLRMERYNKKGLAAPEMVDVWGMVLGVLIAFISLIPILLGATVVESLYLTDGFEWGMNVGTITSLLMSLTYLVCLGFLVNVIYLQLLRRENKKRLAATLDSIGRS